MKAGHLSLILLGTAGLTIALLSALESKIPWLTELCGFFNSGCRDTSGFTLLGVQLSFLGIGYYIALLACILFVRTRVFQMVMLGTGVELIFLYTMITHQIFCIFCLLNLIAVVVLFAMTVEKQRGWEGLALVLLSLVISIGLFTRENKPLTGQVLIPASSIVVARVGSETVTELDLERSMATKLYDARMALYADKMKSLEQIIQDRLLGLEADRLNTTIENLQSSIQGHEKSVGPEEVETLLNENPHIRSSWEGTEEELRLEARSFIQKNRKKEALEHYIHNLYTRYKVEFLLEKPPLPMTRISLGNSPFLGPEDAPVTVVEFSDYLCPACRKAHNVSMEIRNAYQGRIRWVFKDYPLKQHKGAKTLAEAARCAKDQGMFWEYQDMLFLSSEKMDKQDLLKLAAKIGMDSESFERCLKSGTHREDVEEDIRAADSAGVEATPTFIINGKLHPGAPSLAEFREMIETEFEKVRHISQKSD